VAITPRPLVRPYAASDRQAVVALWWACELLRPWNDPNRDIEQKLAHDADGLLVLELDGRVAGSVMAGFDGHRGWVNYLAVDPALRGRGFGALLMNEAERQLSRAGCPKINLQVRASNQEVLGFYQHLGYVVDDVVSMGKRLVDDDARESSSPPANGGSRPPADPEASGPA
jgi:ribosomal protein S18 acetylase RimI-like enzyme